jgi:EAL domain-containing protein (putative c-di-GMP-specific phosphodiesterase class I)
MSPATGESDLALELQLAIERHELSLAYQPKVEIRTGRLAGVEALARWHHPRLGSVEPTLFIGLAERYGSIDALTEWVLRTGLAQWRGWSEQGVKADIAFNISALSLRDIYFPDYLHRLCQTEGVPPKAVTIEVTEGATQHLVRLLDTLTRFRLKGINVSLDDFGTGYSSLLQLRQLPYSELKIDRCFVRDVATSRESRLIVEAMIGLARGFGLTATAEGVEDEATLALLAELGCDNAQGFLIAEPMEGWQLAPWLLDGGRSEAVAPIAAAAGKRRLQPV